jgi:hypothetical protein
VPRPDPDRDSGVEPHVTAQPAERACARGVEDAGAVVAIALGTAIAIPAPRAMTVEVNRLCRVVRPLSVCSERVDTGSTTAPERAEATTSTTARDPAAPAARVGSVPCGASTA